MTTEPTTDPTLTARHAAAVVMERWSSSLVVSNFTPTGWFECDVAEITRSGFLVEYEVKLSKADFRRDADKRKEGMYVADGRADCDHVLVPSSDGVWRCSTCGGRWEHGVIGVKHERLAMRDVRGPSRFYFVTPLALLEDSDVPSWAGWIELCRRRDSLYSAHRRWRPVERRKAPRLHKARADLSVETDMLKAAYARWHTLRIRNEPHAP